LLKLERAALVRAEKQPVTQALILQYDALHGHDRVFCQVRMMETAA
jgi:hypothetical protein